MADCWMLYDDAGNGGSFSSFFSFLGVVLHVYFCLSVCYVMATTKTMLMMLVIMKRLGTREKFGVCFIKSTFSLPACVPVVSTTVNMGLGKTRGKEKKKKCLR